MFWIAGYRSLLEWGKKFPQFLSFWTFSKVFCIDFKKDVNDRIQKSKKGLSKSGKLKNCGNFLPLSIVTCLIWMFVSTTFYIDIFRYKTTKNKNYIITM